MSDDLISREETLYELATSAVYYFGIEEDKAAHDWAMGVVSKMPSAEPERLTDDDFETIRIHLSAYKEKLCNQNRWKEAEEYQRIIDRFMAFASAEPDQKWIPADNPPETDEYILLSFENYSVPMVGRYEDCNYYVGDETEPLCKQDIFVNAWMPLPEPYKEVRADA